MIRSRCGVKEDVVIKIEKSKLRLFAHVERMSERRLTKDTYLQGRCDVAMLGGDALEGQN